MIPQGILDHLRHLRKLDLTREKTSVLDVNGDSIEFPGLTYGSKVLERLLERVGSRLYAAVSAQSGRHAGRREGIPPERPLDLGPRPSHVGR